MSTALTPERRAAVPRPPLFDPRRTRESANKWLLPSWVVSVGLHVVLVLFFAQSSFGPPGRRGKGGGGDEVFGIIAQSWNGEEPGLPGDGTGQPIGTGSGLIINSKGPDDGTAEDPDFADDTDGGKGRESVAESPLNSKAPQTEDAPPVDLELPEAPQITVSRPGVGTGPSLGGGSRSIVKPTSAAGSASKGRGTGSGYGTADGSGNQGGGGKGGKGGGQGGNGGGRGGGGTSFFGHKAIGRKFVYLLDASGSMYDYNAIGVAKSELLSSLSQLDENQHFQVIFYNDKTYPMKVGDRKDELVAATDVNRNLASQFIRNIEPDGGTRHVEALMLALSYNPDVLFFLTDAGEPIMYAADLDKIKRRNNGRTTIFTVEFGKGANLKVDNFLKQLARDNAGLHAYRDVQQFQK